LSACANVLFFAVNAVEGNEIRSPVGHAETSARRADEARNAAVPMPRMSACQQWAGLKQQKIGTHRQARSRRASHVQRNGEQAKAQRKSAMKSPTKAPRSQVARKAARTRKLRAAGRKAALTRKPRAAGKKAAPTRKLRAAGQKAARTRKRKAPGSKAVASPLMKTMGPREWNFVRRVLVDFPKLSVVDALVALRGAGI
jgi:hypothetical protein